ncbi:DUF995 domain-containing protein [Paraburkholderia domus]|jgi:Protein of unknown function (DUF995).|uniref:DUF995 domain-containing protein n=1 Tax=Paraburkholderia domus TaxID=2793075 RepID=A0A9N8MVU0_9BURK|nr:DUF995 domain-containing protein [Paraburkholderia domus]MBK5049338.1 DUF995 domain-containing protein [Burkholderia sp. R-70006]MBK5062099.1 DUF995 domain-containing protein [Burkholderia sp. R-70199]MBK5124278.1 DUF995 domain-containing protein [Burkholderia sp. R-69980]MBK5166940.1 DUF995 domain-containing protein [Burkholderia sp. R-70211]MBK5180713.1 DUF995 domain-containing protein [Burkholderia sp. R-69749]MCI0147787.1 DUF995 domain-containing protein [Paraburkholderia sediminicola]
MTSTYRFAAAASAVLLGCIVFSARAEDEQKLSKEDLMQVIPDSKVISTGPKGNVRRWTNDPSGNFVANWETPPQVKHATGNAQGTWTVNDKGQYCVHIEWEHLQTEGWCAFLKKTADGKYGIASEGHSSWIPTTFELSK